MKRELIRAFLINALVCAVVIFVIFLFSGRLPSLALILSTFAVSFVMGFLLNVKL